MVFQPHSPIPNHYRPEWVSHYPQGRVPLNSMEWPPPNFKIQMPQYNYTLETTNAMLNVANNVGMPQPPILGKTNRLKKTKALAFERFGNRTFYVVPFLLLALYFFSLYVIGVTS
jgi:hypothetical protein